MIGLNSSELLAVEIGSYCDGYGYYALTCASGEDSTKTGEIRNSRVI